jgi:ABC-type multidrug transport system permease subunit
MLRVLPLANALALVTAGVHTLGALFAWIAPGAYRALWERWMLLDLAAVPAGGAGLTLGGFIVGLVTAALLGWLIGLVLAILYNVFAGTSDRASAR